MVLPLTDACPELWKPHEKRPLAPSGFLKAAHLEEGGWKLMTKKKVGFNRQNSLFPVLTYRDHGSPLKRHFSHATYVLGLK